VAASGDVAGAMVEGRVVLTALGTGGVMSPRTLAKLQPVRRAAAQDRRGEDFCAHYDQVESFAV
jgi:hypothetical protein